MMEEAAGTLRASLRALRSLVVDIYPPNINEEGITSALTDLLARAQGSGLATELDVDGLDRELPEATAGLIYRAAQEALRNVVKHAHATTVRVRVAGEDGRAVLEVTDDGRGFEETAEVPSGHVGLKALAGLVADSGGSLVVRSTPGTGTSVRLELPR
jgi:signal transduction histidine kinase